MRIQCAVLRHTPTRAADTELVAAGTGTLFVRVARELTDLAEASYTDAVETVADSQTVVIALALLDDLAHPGDAPTDLAIGTVGTVVIGDAVWFRWGRYHTRPVLAGTGFAVGALTDTASIRRALGLLTGPRDAGALPADGAAAQADFVGVASDVDTVVVLTFAVKAKGAAIVAVTVVDAKVRQPCWAALIVVAFARLALSAHALTILVQQTLSVVDDAGCLLTDTLDTGRADRDAIVVTLAASIINGQGNAGPHRAATLILFRTVLKAIPILGTLGHTSTKTDALTQAATGYGFRRADRGTMGVTAALAPSAGRTHEALPEMADTQQSFGTLVCTITINGTRRIAGLGNAKSPLTGTVIAVGAVSLTVIIDFASGLYDLSDADVVFTGANGLWRIAAVAAFRVHLARNCRIGIKAPAVATLQAGLLATLLVGVAGGQAATAAGHTFALESPVEAGLGALGIGDAIIGVSGHDACALDAGALAPFGTGFLAIAIGPAGGLFEGLTPLAQAADADKGLPGHSEGFCGPVAVGIPDAAPETQAFGGALAPLCGVAQTGLPGALGVRFASHRLDPGDIGLLLRLPVTRATGRREGSR